MKPAEQTNWGDVEKQAVSLIDKGDVLQECGDHKAALASFDKAISICRPLSKTSDPAARLLSQALDNRGNALLELGRVAEALPVFDEAIQIHEGIIRGEGSESDVGEIAVSVMNKGRALMLLDRYDEANECFESAAPKLANCGTCEDCGRLRLNLGALRFRQQRFDESATQYYAALNMWLYLEAEDRIDTRPDRAYTQFCIADALLHAGRYDEALAAVEQSVDLCRVIMSEQKRQKYREGLADALKLRGDILSKLGDVAEA
jgi:tetratricopeptide (TPR) repeat protein